MLPLEGKAIRLPRSLSLRTIEEVNDMAVRDILPWTRKSNGNDGSLIHRSESADPFVSLQKRMNDLFDSFFETGSMSKWRDEAFLPRIELKENDNELLVRAELPGIEEKDLSVELQEGVLRISGEKRSECKEEKGGYYHSECSYGRFDRVIPLHSGLDTDKAKADFRRGVLTVHLPKKAEALANRRKIEVQA
jgi:HSP20 family protein